MKHKPPCKYYFLSEKHKGTPYKYPVIGFDTETDKKGNMVIACVYGERFKTVHTHRKGTRKKRYNTEKVKVCNNEGRALVFYNEADLQDYLQKLYYYTNKKHPSAIITGFNLNYDMKYIWNIVKFPPLISNGQFIGGTIPLEKSDNQDQHKHTGIKIFDLTRHVDGSLSKWIDLLNMKEKGIEKTIWREDMTLDELIYHCQMDAMATAELGKYVQDFYIDTCNMEMHYTIASNALSIYRKTYFKDNWCRKLDDFNIFERKSYRGGRVETFKKGLFVLTTYDINSMYISVMKDKLIPNPMSANWLNALSYEDIKQYDYILDCTVYVPKQHVAPLPYYDNRLKKLYFPIGYFRGVFCKPELEYAIKYCGVKIQKIYQGVYYTESKPYFKEFADFIWSERLKYRAMNDGMDKMIKKLGNSLYGKFGEVDEWTSVYEPEQYEYELNKNPERFIGDGLLEFDFKGKPFYKAYGLSFDSWHTFPIIVSYITSYARLKLLKGIKQFEDEIIYSDTDSIKLPIKIKFESGNDLGEFKNEGITTDYINRPKFYLHYDEMGLIDVEKSKIGGVPKRAIFLGMGWIKDKKYIHDDNGEYCFQYEKPQKLNESIRKFHKHQRLNWNQWNTQFKQISPKDNKRLWINDKESEPIKLDDR